MPMTFPVQRMRRLRRTPVLRRLVAETKLSVDDLVAPLFVREGIDEPQPIASLPGVVQHTTDSLVKEGRRLADLGIPALILFGVPATKDASGSQAWDSDGIVQVALRELRDELGDSMVVMADLCPDEYTEHGHCGLLTPEGEVDNDATIELYGMTAVAQADAGADVVAPSGMMDGQVAAIRRALDDQGHQQTAILAYAAKYASALYGPFRDAVDVTIVGGGDRKGYQQDYRNRRETRTEVGRDLAGGAAVLRGPGGGCPCHRRRRQPLHRLRPELWRVDPRTRPSEVGRSGPAGRGRRHLVRGPDRAGGAVGRGHPRAGAGLRHGEAG